MMRRRTIRLRASGTYNVDVGEQLRQRQLANDDHHTSTTALAATATLPGGGGGGGCLTNNTAAADAAAAANAAAAAARIRCVVFFLDNTKHTFEVDKRAKGEILLDLVFDHLGCRYEREYFGLQFAEVSGSPHDSMRWLDPGKMIKRQFKLPSPYIFYFRVKFYASDPCKLQEEYARYFFFLQIKKDVLENRLMVPTSVAVKLASYAAQSELGDFNSDDHRHGYLTDMRLMPNQTEEMEKLICDMHKLHKGQLPSEAEMNYLQTAKRLDMYGVDLHEARDSGEADIMLGVTFDGLVVFQNNVKINTFSWGKIVKISFKRRKFFIQLRREGGETCDNLIGFCLLSYRSCKNLWKSCVEHHAFFRLHSSQTQVRATPRRTFFSLGSTFRYSGRTEFQTHEELRNRSAGERLNFCRTPSRHPGQMLITDVDGNIKKGDQMAGSLTPNAHGPPSAVKRRGAKYLNGRAVAPPASTTQPTNGAGGSPVLHHLACCVQQVQIADVSNTYQPRKAWESLSLSTVTPSLPTSTTSYSSPPSGKNISDALLSTQPFTPAIPPKLIRFADDDDSTSSSQLSTPNGGSDINRGVVEIRMRADAEGRFGFNVKGGADQRLPILVCRVAPDTPADTCIPGLNEGDQVLAINGKDISGLTHDQVVKLIRAPRGTASAAGSGTTTTSAPTSSSDNSAAPPVELVLTVKPQAYVGEEVDEPDFQYIPESESCAARGGGVLAESILLLAEALENGAAIGQFEQLYRKKANMTMDVARLPQNVHKNRYKDISPYDKTRVVLQNPRSDYINASYITMKIPTSGVVNRYIATQGPLSTTCVDFWQMVWEQQSTLVVMLTTLVERGRIKCHKYWPNLYETETYANLQVSCVSEKESASFAFREFTLINSENKEERHITHMQYLAWPDHGVPDDASDFLHFIERVRRSRDGMVEATIVHCSAGIGRTGVLILMETAMCLIEANEPIYPLDITRVMRDQRAMLIQTASQYKFVCEAIVKIFKEGVVKPLPEYHKAR